MMIEKEVIESKIADVKQKIDSIVIAQLNARNRGEHSMIAMWQKEEQEYRAAFKKLNSDLDLINSQSEHEKNATD